MKLTNTGGYLDGNILWLPHRIPHFENNDEAFRYLKNEISVYSEMYWCAGWLQEIEFAIWIYAHVDVSYSMFDKNLCRKLVEVGKKHNVWVYWDENSHSVLPISIEEWLCKLNPHLEELL